jgi:L-amino acid N-acyltransferase YncA
MRLDIRDVTADDVPAICAIYNHFVASTTVSFEEEEVSAADMAGRIADVRAAGLPWLVVEVGGVVAGYAYATKWRVRHAYRHSVETTVYLAPGKSGQGLGRAVYTALIELLRAAGCHLAIAGIALPNAASVALHTKLGFEKAAHFKEVGFKFARWVDVGYWQLALEDQP